MIRYKCRVINAFTCLHVILMLAIRLGHARPMSEYVESTIKAEGIKPSNDEIKWIANLMEEDPEKSRAGSKESMELIRTSFEAFKASSSTKIKNFKGDLEKVGSMLDEFYQISHQSSTLCAPSYLKHYLASVVYLAKGLENFASGSGSEDTITLGLNKTHKRKNFFNFIRYYGRQFLIKCSERIEESFRFNVRRHRDIESELDSRISDDSDKNDASLALKAEKLDNFSILSKSQNKLKTTLRRLSSSGFRDGDPNVKELTNICARLRGYWGQSLGSYFIAQAIIPSAVASIGIDDYKFEKFKEYYRMCNRWIYIQDKQSKPTGITKFMSNKF